MLVRWPDRNALAMYKSNTTSLQICSQCDQTEMQHEWNKNTPQRHQQDM